MKVCHLEKRDNRYLDNAEGIMDTPLHLVAVHVAWAAQDDRRCRTYFGALRDDFVFILTYSLLAQEVTLIRMSSSSLILV